MNPAAILSSGTLPQWGTFVTLLVAIMGGITVWIKGMPERGRVEIERVSLTARIEEEIRGEAAERFREFRLEVHALRNELHAVRFELQTTAAKSVRRGDKLNMLLFILRMVMDELHSKEPENKTLAQARIMLARVEEEPHQPGASSALHAAEDTVDAAKAAVIEVKAAEASQSLP